MTTPKRSPDYARGIIAGLVSTMPALKDGLTEVCDVLDDLEQRDERLSDLCAALLADAPGARVAVLEVIPRQRSGQSEHPRSPAPRPG